MTPATLPHCRTTVQLVHPCRHLDHVPHRQTPTRLQSKVYYNDCPVHAWAGYDEEARYFESAVRSDKRRELVASAYGAVANMRHAQLDMLCVTMLHRFKADLAAALESKDGAFTATAAGCEVGPLLCSTAARMNPCTVHVCQSTTDIPARLRSAARRLLV